MASALGIDTARVNSVAFALGAALAATAGVLIAPLTVVVVQMGINYLARSFFVVIVGGASRVLGVVAGSSVVGGLETLMIYQLPPHGSRSGRERVGHDVYIPGGGGSR